MYINKRLGWWLVVLVYGNGLLKDIVYMIFKIFEIFVFNGIGIYKFIKCIF